MSKRWPDEHMYAFACDGSRQIGVRGRQEGRSDLVACCAVLGEKRGAARGGLTKTHSIACSRPWRLSKFKRLYCRLWIGQRVPETRDGCHPKQVLHVLNESAGLETRGYAAILLKRFGSKDSAGLIADASAFLESSWS